MKDIIILTATILVMIYGFRIMMYIDNFLNQGGFQREGESIVSKKVLVMQSAEIQSEDADMIEALTMLNHYAATYDVIYSPLIPDSCTYDYVMALSGSDVDNLILCAESKRMLQGAYTVAKCNDKVYESVFHREDVDEIVFDEAGIKRIFQKQVVA